MPSTPSTARRRQLVRTILTALLSLPAAPLAAQTTLFFNNGENFGSHSTTTVASPLTVNITSGLAAHNGVISGDGTLSKTGDGTITLTQANTYTGATNLAGGTLVLSGTTTSSLFDLATATTLEFHVASGTRDQAAATTFTGSGTLAKTGAGTLVWGASAATFALGSGALIDVQAGTLVGGSSINEDWTANLADLQVASGATFSGTEANVRVDALTGGGTITSGFDGAGYSAFTFGVDGGSGTFSGVLADTDTGNGHIANFTKAGSGTQILTGANTYTGVTTIAGGTLQLGDGVANGSLASASIVNHGTLVLNRTDDYVFNNVVSGTGGLVHDGYILRFANPQTYTGPTSVKSGAYLVLSTSADHTLSASTSVDLESGSFLDLSNRPQTIAGLSGAGTVYSYNLAGGSGSVLTLAVADGQTFDFAGTLGHTFPNFALTKSGLGTQTLSGPNTYTGATTVSGGTLVLGSNTALGTTAAGTSVAPGATLALTNDITVAEAIANDGAVTNLSGANTLSGALSGSGYLEVAGGTLTLTAANTHTDNSLVSAGTLVLGHIDALQNSTAHLTGGSLDFGSLTAANLGGLSGSQNLSLTNTTPAPVALSVGANHATTSYSGTLSGTGTLAKIGDGTLTLSGPNTYTGTTTVSAGSLIVASDTALGTTDAGTSVASGATLTLTDNITVAEAIASAGTLENDSGNNTLSGVLSGSGNLDVSGGSLTLNAANTFSGPTSLNGGNLVIAHPDALQFSTLNWSSSNVDWGSLTAVRLGGLTGFDSMALENDSAQPVTLTVGGNGTDTTFSGYFTATSGSLIKTGGGTLYLDNFSYHTGSTTIEQGTLRINHDSALGAATGNELILDGGTLQTVNNSLTLDPARALTLAAGGGTFDGDITYSGVITGPGGLTKSGPGALTLGGANTFSGQTDVTAGSLTVTNGLALQNSTLVLDGTGYVRIDIGSDTLHLGGLSGSANITESSLDPEEGLSAPGLYELSGDLSIGANNESTTYSGVIDGNSLSLTKVGTGTLTLSGASTYGGTTSILGGTLSISAANNLGETSPFYSYLILNGGTLRTTADLTFSSDSIVEIGTAHGTIETATGTTFTLDSLFDDSGNLTKTGAGSLHLGANSYTLDGVFTAAAGTVRIADRSSLESAEVQLTGGTFVFGDSLDSATFAGLGGSSNLLLENENAGAVALTVGYSSGRDTTYSGVLSGPGSLELTTGTLQLSNENTFTGAVTVGGGKLVLGHTHALATQTITMDGELAFADVTSAHLAQLAGSGSVTLHNDTNAAVTLTVGGNHASTSFSGQITGTGGLTKTGTGDLSLSGMNEFYGDTTITGGTITLTDDYSLNGSTVTTTGGLRFSGITSAEFGNISGTENLLLENTGGSALALGVGSNNGSTTFGGVISGSGSLTKNGEGSLTLTGANTYTGATTLSRGTLSIATESALGTAPGSPTPSHLTLYGATLATTASLTLDANRGVALFTPDAAFSPAADTTLTIDGIVTGSGRLTKHGDGTLLLTGANTYTGAITVSAGTLSIAADSALGTAPGVATAGHLTLDGGTLATTASFTLAPNRGIALTSSGGTFHTADATTLSYGGIIAGSGGLTKSGLGTLTLTGANTYSGGTTVSAGTLTGTTTSLQGDIANHAALVFDQDTNGTYTGVISGTGTLGKSGSGNVTLAGANPFSGDTTLSAGTLTLSNADALQHSTAVLSGGVLAFDTITAANLAGLSGSGDLALTNGSAGVHLTVGSPDSTTTYSGALSGDGSLTKLGTGTLTLTGANTYTGGTTVSAGTLQGDTTSLTGNITNNAHVTFDQSAPGTYAGVISGSGSFTKSGLGTLTLSGAQTYTGATSLAAGTLQQGASNRLSSSTALTIDSGASFDLNDFSAQLTSLQGVGNVDLGSGTLTLTPSVDQEFSGNVLGSGNLYKFGTGTLTLSGVNDAFGLLVLDQGTLQLGSDTALRSGTTVSISAGATLALNDRTATASFGVSEGSIHLGAGSGSLTIEGPNASLVGQISGGGTLIKSGPNALSLSGANTYTGTTVIEAGTIDAYHASALGASVVDIRDGGTLALHTALTLGGLRGSGSLNTDNYALTVNNTGDDLFSGGIISGFGPGPAFTKTGSGTLTLAGENTASSLQVFVEGGTLGLATSNPISSFGSTITIAPGGTLALSNHISTSLPVTNNGTFQNLSGNNLYGGTLTGTGTLTVEAGQLTLTGTSSAFTGTASLNGGTLLLGSGDALTAPSAITIASGATLDLNSLSRTYPALDGAGNIALGSATLTTGDSNSHSLSGVISGPGSLTKIGSGTLTLSGANTYGGGTTLSAGTVSISADANLGQTYGALTLDGGTLLATSALSLDAARTIQLGASGGTLASDATLTVASQISGSGNLGLGGEGTITLANFNSFTGTTTLLDGDLTVNVAHPLALQGSVVAPRGGLRFSGIDNATFGGLNGADSEFVYLHLENTDADPVALTLQVSSSPTGDTNQRSVISGSGSLIMAGSGTQTLSAANTFTGTTTLSSGTLALAHPLALQGSTVQSTGGQLSYDGISTATFGGLAGSGSIDLPSTSLSVGANNVDTTFSGTLQGSGLLIKVGSGNLTFASNSSGFHDVRLDAGRLTLGFSSALQNSGVALNGGTLGFGTLTFASLASIAGSGNLALANASAEPVALFLGGSSDTTYSGQLSGPGSLTLALSSGNLTLSGANTFSGSTTLNSGTLTLAHALALQNSTLNLGFGSLSFGNLSTATLGGLAGSGSFQLPSTSLTVGANNADTTFSGAINGSGLLIKTGTGNLTFAPVFSSSHDVRLDAGTFTLGNSGVLFQSKLELNGGALGFGALTSAYVGGLAGSGDLALANDSADPVALFVGGSGDTTYSGSLSGPGSLTKTAFGTFTLTGAHTFTGATTIDSGDLVLASTASLAGPVTLSSGTLTLANPTGLAASTVQLNGGQLAYDGIATATLGGLAGSGALTLPTTSLSVGANNADTTFTGYVGNSGLLIKVGTGNLTFAPSFSNGHDVRLDAGTFTPGAISTLEQSALELNGGTLGFGPLTEARLGRLSGSGDLTLLNSAATPAAVTLFVGSVSGDSTYAGSLSGPGALTKTGFGTFTLTGAHIFTGATTLSDGTLALGANASLAGDFILSSGTLSLANPTGLAASTVHLNGGTLAYDGITTATFGGLAGSNELSLPTTSLTVGGNDQDTTYSGTIRNPGTLIKAGTGTLTFDGQFDDSAALRLDAGTFTLGTSAVLDRASVALNGGALDFGQRTTATFNGLNGTDSLALLNSAATPAAVALTLGYNGADSTYSGVISGPGSLDLVGGTLTLSAANTFTGETTLDNGNLVLTATGSLAGGVTVDNGTLTLANPTGLAASTVTVNGGTLSFDGLTEVTFGGLAGSSSLSLPSNSLTIGGNNQNTTYSGSLSGSGVLIKTGTGDFAFNASYPDTNNFQLDAGTLSISDSSILRDSTVHLNGGTLGFGTLTDINVGRLTGSGDLVLQNAAPTPAAVALTVGNQSEDATYAGVLSGPGSLTKTGFGTVTLSGANTFTGGTTVSQGTLRIGAGGTTGSLVGDLTNDANLIFDRSDALVFAGSISGSGNLTQSGSGTLTLAQGSAATGTLTVSAGTLNIGQGGVASLGATDITNHGTLNFNHTNDLTLSGTISGSGTFTKSGPGTLTAPNLISSGAITVNSGNLINNNSIGDRVVSISGETASFTQNNSVSKSVGLSGVGSLSIAAGGTFALTNASNTLVLGTSTGSTGTATVNGHGSNLTSASSLRVGSSGNGTLNIEAGATASFASTIDSPVGRTASGVGTVNLTDTGSSLTLGGALIIGDAGTGTVTLGSGSTLTADRIQLAQDTGSTGTLNLNTGGTLVVSDATDTALSSGLGTATLNFAGGTLRSNGTHGLTVTSDITLADATTSTVDTHGQSATLSGVLSGFGALAKSGAGTLTLSGANTHEGGISVNAGTLAITNHDQLGTGALTITNGGELIASAVTIWSQDLTVDGNGSRFVTPTGTGGLLDAPLEAYSGGLASALTVTNGGALEGGFLGFSGNGTDAAILHVSAGGTLTAHQSLALGYDSSAEITLNVSGPGSTVHVGDRNAPSDNALVIGSYNPSGPAVVSVSDGGRIDAEAVAIGLAFTPFEANRGRLDIHAGGTVETLFVQLGTTSADEAILNLNTGGTLQIHGGVDSLSAEATGGSVNLKGGTLTVSTNAFSTTANATLGGGTTSTIHTDGVDATWSGVLSGSGALAKSGSGTLTLTAANAYSGGTTVNAGTLLAGHASAFGTGPITVSGGTLDFGGYTLANSIQASGGTLAGLANFTGTQTIANGTATYSGTVGGNLAVNSGGTLHTTGATFTGTINVASGGTLSGTGLLGTVTVASGGAVSPGNSPGLLTVGDGSVFSGTLNMEIGGLLRGTEYDAINVSGGGSLTVGGTLNVTLINAFTPMLGDSFQLFQATSIGGTFAQVNLPTIAPGLTWNTARLLDDGTLSVSAIPEPSAFAALAGLATLALATTRRRRR